MDLSFPDFLLNDTVQNDNLNSTDLTKNYLSLKKKICETHEVIKQYNDKLKECERLKSDLDAVTKQTKKATCNYNSTLAKVIKLEIQNTEYKKNIDILTTQVDDHKIKAAADQQYIQQLICKIKDVESQNNDIMMECDLKKSSSEMKIKELEAELKTTRKTYETKIKKMEKKSPAENNDCHSSNNIITKDVVTNTCSNSNNIITKNVVTNTCSNSNNIILKNATTNTGDFITKNVATNTYKNQTTNVGTITTLTKDEIMKKPQVSDKCVLTNEFYSIKDDMYPIFCAKCEVHIQPTPFDKICKIMTESCPKLIEKISSPIKKPVPVLPDVTSGYSKADNLIALPETPQNFHKEIARSAFASPNLTAPTPLDHLDYCHNFSQSPGLLSQSAFCNRSTPTRVPLANITTASQTDHCEGKTLDASSQSVIFKLQDQVDMLAKKLRKKMKKLKSQKSSSCCQHSYPNSPYMFDMNNTMQFNFMELCRRMSDMCQPKEKEPVVVHKLKDKTPKKSKLFRMKPTKRLRSAYSGSSWEVESVSKKAEKSSTRKRPKKHKHRHSMLLKKSDVSIENSEHLEEPASDSDSNLYDNLFDASLTNEDVSNESKDSSCEETVNETCNDVIKPLTHNSANSTDMDEPETVDRVKNLVECGKSMGGETDSGILSDSVDSSKLVQYEPDLDSCFVRKTCRNARVKATVKSAPSFSTEKSPTNEVLPLFLQEEPETPNASEEPEISESTSTNVTFTRKRKFGELEEPKHRLELMRKLRNLTKKPIKIQTFPKLHIMKEVAYCENQREEEKKKHQEQEAEIVEENYVPKKKARIAHVCKVAKKANISLNSCVQAETSLVKNVKDDKVKPQTATVDITESDTNITEETNMTQKTPVQTVTKEDSEKLADRSSSEKLADRSSSETVEDIDPLSSNLDSPNEMSGDDRTEQLKIVPVDPVFDISVLIEQSEQSRKGLEFFSAARKKSVTEIGNATNNISALEQSEQRRKGLEINLLTNNGPVVETDNTTNDISTLSEQSEQTRRGFGNNLSARKKSVTETDNTTNNISASIEQSEQTRKGLEINLPTCIRSVETDNIENESNDELRIDESNQLKEWATANDRLNESSISPSCQDNDNPCRVEEVVENNKPFYSKGPQTDRKYRAKEMHYYKDIKLNSYAPVEILERLNHENSFKNIHCKRQSENIRAATDMFVTKQLQRLVDSEWESDVHQDVFEKLKTACTHRIIAKNIVHFLSTEEECQQILDKTHTPPAPLMTKSQQRITTLLVDLEKEFPMIIKLVQSGIEYKIFKFNQKLYKYIVESLARMYTVLARVQKDRQRVRIFCCDALYCLGLNATIVLYTVFTSWPEVLPSNDTTKDYLPKCIAHLILSMGASDYPKLSALKSLVRIYYKYPLGTLSKDIIIDLLKAFQEKCQGEVMAAITLLAKKEGTAWTYKNIIKGVLLPMIVNNKCHSGYKAFCLLGTLLRPFPIDDEDKAVGDIVEQLSDLCDSDAVSFEQQEGVMSALMSLSRHKFDVVLPHVLKWTPNLPLRDRTVDQICGLYNVREPTFWSWYIRRYKKTKT